MATVARLLAPKSIAAGQDGTLYICGGAGLSYAYDGALVTGKTWTGTVPGTVNYSYDNDFRPVAISLNGSDTIYFLYDADGLLSQAGALNLRRNSQNGLLAAGPSYGYLPLLFLQHSFRFLQHKFLVR